MAGISWAAILLAIAVLTLPVRPGRRLGQRGPLRRAAVPGCLLGLAVAVAAVWLLPAMTLLAVTALTVTTLHRRRRALRRRRAGAQRRALSTALEVLVGELRSGAHPVRAFESAAVDAGAGVGPALAGVAARARLGADVGRGLRAAAAGTALGAEWDRIAVAWQLAADHGMAISAMMRAAQTDIVERQHFWSRVQAELAGARATAAILAGLPVLGIGLGELIGAAPVAYLTGGGTGGWCLLIGTGLVCVGLCWADRIIDRLPT